MIRGACVALATFLLVTAARAEPSTSEARAMAETLFFTGRGLMEAGRYAEACQKFAESYRLDPAAGTLLNLAVCHEKEGKIASAWGEFKQALSDAKKADRPDREELAAEHIAAIEPELPFLAINVPPDARVIGLEVVRNGSPLLSGSWGTELPVDPGPVEIVVRAPGYVAQSRKLTIERKQHLTVTIDPLTPLPKVAPPPPPVVSDTGWSARRRVGFALIGAGVVGVGLGGYFGLRAASDKSKSDDLCPAYDGERRCSEAGAARMDDAQRNAWISNIGIGLGAATIAAGTYLFVTGARSKPVDLAISAGPNGIGAVLSGCFQ